MFLLRSAFWLAIAFFVMSPKHVDLNTAADDIAAQALSAGQQFIVGQILDNSCAKALCRGAAISFPSVDTPMHDSSSTVPLPRPRPARMG